MMIMKRQLLSTFLMCVFFSLYSQTTVDTALPLQEGYNTYTFESSTGENNVYYVYTAPEEQGKLLTVEMADPSTSVRLSEDGSYNTTINGITTSNTRIYPIKRGQTVYLTVSAYYSASVEFTVTLTDADVEKGASCEDPIIATEEGEFFVPSYYDTSTYTNNPTYISYTCPEDGLLEMTFGGYPSSLFISEGCDGTQESLTTSTLNGKYIAKYGVEAGKTYIVKLNTYSPLMATFLLTHPTIGSSCDMPFDAIETGNVLPKDAGTYWYQYTNTEAGFMIISSDYSLAGGNISIYKSCYDYSPYASINGYFDIRCEVFENTTYLICIEKTETTTTDETFDITVEPAQTGDSMGNPFIITEGDYNTPHYNGTYYYSITVPEGDPRFLIVDATATELLSSNTKVTLYAANNPYSPLAQGQDYFKSEVSGGTTYIITWNCNEGINDIPFTVSYETIEQGDVCSNPLDAVAGENNLQAGSKKYYQYTATLTGWLLIDTDITINVSFPENCSQYSGMRNAVKTGTITKTEVVAGNSYLIQFENIEYETTFFLSEEEYQEGESCETAIEVEPGVIELPASVLNMWYKYTATHEGKVVINSDIVYEQSSDYRYSSMVSVKEGDCSGYATAIIKTGESGTVFNGQFIVSEGDVLYINVVTLSAQSGKSLSIEILDLEPGESCSNPIIIEEEGEIIFPESSRALPVWYSVELGMGDFSVSSTSYISLSLYDNCDATSPLAISNYIYDYETYIGTYLLTYTVPEGEEGIYILKLDYSYNNTVATIVIPGIENAVKSITTQNTVKVQGNIVTVTPENSTRTNVEIYDITGKKIEARAIYGTTSFSIEQRGIYIVKINNDVKKIAINR